jgi:hypothetical protein
MVAAHTAPPANSVTPVMKIAVSNRVIIQLLRMTRLNRWIVSELAWPRTVNEWLISFRRLGGELRAAIRPRGIGMMWFLLQSSIIFAVVASNIRWHWTPNGYVARFIGIGLAWLVTLCGARLWKHPWYHPRD